MDEGSRRQGQDRRAGIQDQQVQGRRQLLRDLRHQQGRQEGRDLFRRQDARSGEVRGQELVRVGAGAPVSDKRVLVWDAVVRVLHWSLAATIAFDFIHDDGDPLHRAVGYVAAVIVALRLLWSAFAGGATRWSALRPSLRVTLDYCRRLMQGRPPQPAGHDPLGLWMVWLLWLLVLLLGVTGWMSRLDA